MRAERLPDLVNQTQAKRRSTVETIVTATFDISDVADKLITEGEDEIVLQSDQDEAQALAAGAIEVEINHQVATDQNSNGLAVQNGNSHNRNGAVVQNGSRQNGTPPSEWQVTRRLRVTAQGTYTSNYYINGEPCTLNQLHEQLQRFRIYPEGYNVVLQGDVTSIISMNARERREIIDELAGVASFDRKINQAKSKLDVVKDREERFRIVETELTDQLERLDQDRKKAEKYKQLKATLQAQQRWESVMIWRSHQQQAAGLAGQIERGQKEGEGIEQKIAAIAEQMKRTAEELEGLNAQVKALGEEEYLALQATLATQEAELRQLVRQSEGLGGSAREIAVQLGNLQTTIQTQESQLETLGQRLKTLTEGELEKLEASRDEALRLLEAKREETTAIADQSQAWIKQQTDLRHQIETLLAELEPQRSERVRLQERISQLEAQTVTQRESLASLEREMSGEAADSDDSQREKSES